MDDLSKTLLTISGTLLVAVIGALVAARVQSQREHAKWAREQRFELCRELLRIVADVRMSDPIPDLKSPADEPFRARYRSMHEVVGTLGVVGPARLERAGRDVLVAVNEVHAQNMPGAHETALNDMSRATEQFQIAAGEALHLRRTIRKRAT